jgi:DNA-binding CsgD family transcriptional regulator
MERLLAAAEELTGMGSWELDLRTLEGVWSDGMFRIHGIEPGSAGPGVEMLLANTHDEDRERLGSLLAMVVETPEQVPREGLTAEYRAVRADGSIREVRFHGIVERNVEGRPTRWVGAAQDVTEQRLTERELHAHYAVSQALRDWESFEEGVIGLLRRLGTALDYPLGILWTWDEAQEQLTARAFWSAPGVDARRFEAVSSAISFAPGQGIPGQVWVTGQPAVVDDVSEDLRTVRRTEALNLGLRSAVAFPAVGDDGPLAVLTFYALDRRAPSERLVRTLTGIGRELGRFLARRRADLGTRRLTRREMDVLELAAEGMTGPQIAERLFVSPATVKTHFQHIYEKLGVGDRAGAVAHALRTGIIR